MVPAVLIKLRRLALLVLRLVLLPPVRTVIICPPALVMPAAVINIIVRAVLDIMFPPVIILSAEILILEPANRNARLEIIVLAELRRLVLPGNGAERRV